MAEPPTLSLKMLNFKYKFGFSFNFSQKMQTKDAVCEKTKRKKHSEGSLPFNADALMHL